MPLLSSLFTAIQESLFPALEESYDPLTEKQREFVRVVELIEIEKHMLPYRWGGFGRRRKERVKLALAFIAKAIYSFDTTLALIDYLQSCKNMRRLCGWELTTDIPSESTFSRAFAEFAAGQLPAEIHEAMVKKHCGPKLAGHVSRDSTAIGAREKPAKKRPAPPKAKRKRGRPRKGEVREPKPPKRLDLQPERSFEENIQDLPHVCDVGAKQNSKGYKETWIGYKLHLDCVDGDIPVSAILTSASVHDSQAAIPLGQMTNGRVTSLYDLMDSAYDAPQIHAFSESLGHVPIIDHNKRGGEQRPMDPAQAVRYRERSAAERVNSNLKDNHGCRTVRVRGAAKVMCHLMFGIIAITATQLFRLLE